MNSQPLIVEGLSRAAIWKGLTRALLLVRAISCRADFEEGGHAACVRVLRRIEEERYKHLKAGQGTPFPWRQP